MGFRKPTYKWGDTTLWESLLDALGHAEETIQCGAPKIAKLVYNSNN